MDDILYALWNGDYDPTPERDREDKALSDQSAQFGSAVKEAFGLDFMDRWGEIEGEQADRRAFQHYREGFRLGVRLVLEAIRPA